MERNGPCMRNIFKNRTEHLKNQTKWYLTVIISQRGTKEEARKSSGINMNPGVARTIQKDEKGKRVSFLMPKNEDRFKHLRGEAVVNSKNLWYSSDDLRAFLREAHDEVRTFRHHLMTRKMGVLSSSEESRTQSALEMEAALLSDLEKCNTLSLSTRSSLTSTTRGLEHFILHGHNREMRRKLASRAILKFHKKSETLIQTFKTETLCDEKRARLIAAKSLAVYSLKHTAWAKRTAIQTARLNSIGRRMGRVRKPKFQELRKREKYQGKKMRRRHAISLVNLELSE